MVYWYSMSSIRDCKYSQRFALAAEELIFSVLSANTPPEIVAQARSLLEALHKEWQTQCAADPFHFSAAEGSHRCLDASYQVAVLRLQSFSLREVVQDTQPAPQPPPPKPERLMTPLDVVKALRNRLEPQTDATPLGIDDETPDLEQNE